MCGVWDVELSCCSYDVDIMWIWETRVDLRMCSFGISERVVGMEGFLDIGTRRGRRIQRRVHRKTFSAMSFEASSM